MKKRIGKFGLIAAFGIGMLSLTACSEPQCSYGAPVSSDDSCYSDDSEPQDVYGPPPAFEDSSESEELSSADVPQVVYGPPAAQDEDAGNVPEATPSP